MHEHKPFCLEVWGDYACFTRPELKVERVSYDVPTPRQFGQSSRQFYGNRQSDGTSAVSKSSHRSSGLRFVAMRSKIEPRTAVVGFSSKMIVHSGQQLFCVMCAIASMQCSSISRQRNARQHALPRYSTIRRKILQAMNHRGNTSVCSNAARGRDSALSSPIWAAGNLVVFSA